MTIFDFVQQREYNQQPQQNEFPELQSQSDLQVEKMRPEQDTSQYMQNEEDTTGKRLARGASRVIETAIGAPRQMIEFPQKGIIYGAEKIAGKQLPQLRKAAENVSGRLPSSQGVRESISKATGGYTEPKTQKQIDEGEFIEDITSLSLPGAGTKAKEGGQLLKLFGKSGSKYVKALGIATAGKTAKETAQALGASEATQDYAKSGTMLAASLLSPRAAKKAAEKQYNLRDASYNHNEVIHVPQLKNKYDSLIKEAGGGGKTPSSREVISFIESLKENLKNGYIKVQDLVKAKTKINTFRKDAKYIDRIDQHLFDKAAHLVDEELAHYGKSNSPFIKHHKAGDEMFGAVAQAGKYSNWIREKVFPYMGKHPWTATVLFPLTTGAYPAAKTIELGLRIWKSPKLRNLYTEALLNASKENVKQTSRVLTKLDSELQKQLESEKEIDVSKYK